MMVYYLKTLKKKHENSLILSLTVNTDGADIYASSKGSLWPLQAYQN